MPWDKSKEDSNQKIYDVNKKFLYLNIFEGLNDRNIITLVIQTKTNNSEKDDDIFETILRRVETRMSETILITIYGTMKIDDKSTEGYYIIQWTNEMYIPQEDKDMQGYKPTITAYAGEIMYDDVFLNPVPNSIYWFIPMNKGVGDVTVRLKQVLLPSITIMKIGKKYITKKMQQKSS